MLYLATANQIDMMKKSASRYSDLELESYNLARLSLAEVRPSGGAIPDIVLVMLPVVSSIDDMRECLKRIGSPDVVISVGKDIRLWALNTVEKEVAQQAYAYLSNSGQDNYDRVLDYILAKFARFDLEVRPPVEMPMHGLVDLTRPGEVFQDLDGYKGACGWDDSKPSVCFAVSREAWVSGNYGARRFLFESLKGAGLSVVTIMSKPKDDPVLGAWGLTTTLYKMLTKDGEPLVDAFIANSYMQYDVMDGQSILMSETELVRRMNIPVFCPMELRDMTQDDWESSDSIGGLISTRIVLPELKGFIEPIPMSVIVDHSPDTDYSPLEERCDRIASRVYKRAMLRKKPNRDKVVVFMMNIGACSTLEATIGLSHGLDSMESVVRMMRSLKDDGYDVEPPESGSALRETIVSRRAYPEFRWTAVSETVSKGGVMYRMSSDEYRSLFGTLDPKVREEVVKVWGEPPGEGMLDEGDIIIPGVRYGNTIVMVQPKRGCVGRECSGKKCKVLTDPYCPPNHHYIATYLYLDRILGVDIIVGMGSHGTMEHLPGKTNGLSGRCYPDICIGSVPNLYVFDACDSVHATIAKRRGYATILSHAPPVVHAMELSAEMRELADLVGSFNPDGGAAYLDSFEDDLESGLSKAGVILPVADGEAIGRRVEKTRELLDSIVSSYVETGAHVFGDVPDDAEIEEMAIASEPESESDVVKGILSGKPSDDQGLNERVISMESRMRDCYEMGSFIDAADGRFTLPGPAGNVLRGRTGIYPTGRNLHGANPDLLPTRVAYKVGCELADRLLEAYLEENGSYPEEVALSWMSNDLTIADGELIGQAMSLIGAEPVWSSDGKVNGFTIVPLERMEHPRIDILVRPAGTVLSVFKSRIDLLDRAIEAVSMLDEPDDRNYLHAHVMESLKSGVSEAEATSRIFGIGPGMPSGLYYAVMASAWEKDSDLAGIFLNNNGYAYGHGKDGVPMHGQFGYQLSKVSASFNKIASDDKDLLLSGGFFVSQGGIALATEDLTGRKVKAYYGDTRRSSKVSVRTLSEEIGRLSAAKVLNPQWIEANMAAGYGGATLMMSAVQKLYGWQITTKDVDDRVFDGITRKYVMDEKVRDFLQEANPYALEDLERRMLELDSRGLWKADPDVLDALKDDYLELEAYMEDITEGEDCQRSEIVIDRMDGSYEIGKGVEDTREIIRKRLRRRRDPVRILRLLHRKALSEVCSDRSSSRLSPCPLRTLRVWSLL